MVREIKGFGEMGNDFCCCYDLRMVIWVRGGDGREEGTGTMEYMTVVSRSKDIRCFVTTLEADSKQGASMYQRRMDITDIPCKIHTRVRTWVYIECYIFKIQVHPSLPLLLSRTLKMPIQRSLPPFPLPTPRRPLPSLPRRLIPTPVLPTFMLRLPLILIHAHIHILLIDLISIHSPALPFNCGTLRPLRRAFSAIIERLPP